MDRIRIPIPDPYAEDLRRDFHGRQVTALLVKNNFLQLNRKPSRQDVDVIGDVQGHLFKEGNVECSTEMITTQLLAFNVLDGKVTIRLDGRYVVAECKNPKVLYDSNGNFMKCVVSIPVKRYWQGEGLVFEIDAYDVVQALRNHNRALDSSVV